MATTGSVKAKILNLRDKANNALGQSNEDLTTAVDAMVEDIEQSKPRIAYGDTAPEDTTKLWAKTSEPKKVVVSPNIETIAGEYEFANLARVFDSYGRANAGCAAVGSKIYLFSGIRKGGVDGKIFRYDADTGEFVTLSVAITGTAGNAKAVAMGTQIYVFVGASVYLFDVGSETISVLTTSFGVSTTELSVVAGGQVIYVIGTTANYSNTFGYWRPGTDCVFTSYDITLPKQAIYCGACYYSVNDELYVFGGHGSNYSEQLNIYRYYVATGGVKTIATEATLDYRLFNFGISVVGSKALLVGGDLGPGAKSNAILCFDFDTKLLTTLTATTTATASGISCATYKNNVYCFGGQIDASNYDRYVSRLSENVQYVVDEDVLHITPTMVGNFVNVVDNEKVTNEIGVGKVYKGNAEGVGEQVEVALYKDGAWTTI